MRNQPRILVWAFLFLGLLPALVFSQTASISGTVSFEGRPAPGINVHLEGTLIGMATDLDGRYVIERIPAGSYTLVASGIGYISLRYSFTITTGGQLVHNFEMIEEILRTEEVVVTAARREQLSRTAPVSISIIQPDALEARNVDDIDDALRYVPGVQMLDNQVNVRGSSGFAYGVGSRVQFLIDGIPMPSPETGAIPFDIIPTSQIKQVEIIKGPGSALYGSGALGGVINVITKDYPEKPQTDYRLYYGTFPPVRYQEWRNSWDEGSEYHFMGGASLSHATRIGKRTGLWLNANYRESEGYMQNLRGTEFHASGKVGFTAGSLKFDLLSALSLTEKYDFVFWANGREALRVSVPSRDFINGTSNNNNRKLAVLPTMTHVISPRVFYSLKGRFYGVHLRPIQDQIGTLAPEERQSKGARYGGELQTNIDLLNSRFLVFGASYDQNITDSKRFLSTDDPLSQPEAAVFAQYEQTIHDRLIVVLGGRYDTYQIDGEESINRFSPKLNLSYIINPLLTVRATVGRGFRIPWITERLANNNEFVPVIPNPDIRPEESTGYELGVKTFFPLPSGWGGQIDIAGFWNDYTDLVEPRFNPDRQAFQFVNITGGRIRGVESALGFGSKDQRFYVEGAYTYLDAQDLTAAEPVPLVFRSEHLVQLSANANPVGPLELGLDFRYASAFKQLDEQFGVFIDDADVHFPTKVLDARIGLRFGGFRFNLIAKNAAEYYYMERPAILAPIRHFIVQLAGTF